VAENPEVREKGFVTEKAWVGAIDAVLSKEKDFENRLETLGAPVIENCDVLEKPLDAEKRAFVLEKETLFECRLDIEKTLLRRGRAVLENRRLDENL
jgi:hypothetical protein